MAVDNTNGYLSQITTLPASPVSPPTALASAPEGAADLNAGRKKTLSWHIPRPSLISSQTDSIYNSIPDYRNHGRGSTSTQGSTSSTNSTQSAKSGSLLLTVANLAKINQEHRGGGGGGGGGVGARGGQQASNLQYYLDQQQQVSAVNAGGQTTVVDVLGGGHVARAKDFDALSVASSTHFTVVNGVDRHRAKISRSNGCCRKHKLTVLVVTMSSLFMFGIIVAVYLFEMRAMQIRNS